MKTIKAKLAERPASPLQALPYGRLRYALSGFAAAGIRGARRTLFAHSPIRPSAIHPSTMRVIAGHAKGRQLLSVPGDTTRPIADRVKTALFSILESQDAVRDSRWLDLFGGTGAVGIEALSRGAAQVVFIERNPRAVQVIGQNLRHTGLAQGANVVRGDAFAYLARPDLAPFDVIYIAPPQYQGLWRRALLAIDARPELLTETGQTIVQIHPKEDEPELALVTLERYDARQYGSTRLAFYQQR